MFAMKNNFFRSRWFDFRIPSYQFFLFLPGLFWALISNFRSMDPERVQTWKSSKNLREYFLKITKF